jgi:CheY-like chemotaxis protein
VTTIVLATDNPAIRKMIHAVFEPGTFRIVESGTELEELCAVLEGAPGTEFIDDSRETRVAESQASERNN